MLRPVVAAVLALGLSAPVFAQPAQAPGQTKPAEPPAAAQPPRPDPPGMNANIKLDLTITDQSGAGEPLRKVVTMMVADRGMGSIRSTGSVRSQGRVQINVDARPALVANSQLIRLTLGLEYNPRTLGQDSPTEWSSLNEQITVMLEAGKPQVISQAADPASDRKIVVEVRATVLK